MSSRGDAGSRFVEFKKEETQSVPQRSNNYLNCIGAFSVAWYYTLLAPLAVHR
jgi:hypothetical protein